MWSAWDEVPEGQARKVLELRVRDLRVHNLVWRIGRVVVGIEDAGINSASLLTTKVTETMKPLWSACTSTVGATTCA